MKPLLSIVAVSLALTSPTFANANDVEDGEQLYVLQCEKCHGAMSGQETGFREPFDSSRRIQLAMLDSVTSSAADLVSWLIPASGTNEAQLMSMPTGEHLAVALPNGPTLRGVVGRPAASVEGYSYSKAMLATLAGVVWSEEKLDRWITNSQAWVPGSFMYYKMPDPETRRKVILFLKANP